MFFCCERATVLVTDDSDGGKHLIIILNNPVEDKVATIPVCTARRTKPGDCILYSGSHSFIKNDSYIRFQHASIASADELTKKVSSKKFKSYERISNEDFERITESILSSAFISSDIKQLLTMSN